jgi:penicillin-binding protein 1A
MSLPTWALFMKKCYADADLGISAEDFEKPIDIRIPLDCESLPELDEAGEVLLVPTLEEETDF